MIVKLIVEKKNQKIEEIEESKIDKEELDFDATKSPFNVDVSIGGIGDLNA
jgi:hypothetical protein